MPLAGATSGPSRVAQRDRDAGAGVATGVTDRVNTSDLASHRVYPVAVATPAVSRRGHEREPPPCRADSGILAAARRLAERPPAARCTAVAGRPQPAVDGNSEPARCLTCASRSVDAHHRRWSGSGVTSCRRRTGGRAAAGTARGPRGRLHRRRARRGAAVLRPAAPSSAPWVVGPGTRPGVRLGCSTDATDVARARSCPLRITRPQGALP